MEYDCSGICNVRLRRLKDFAITFVNSRTIMRKSNEGSLRMQYQHKDCDQKSCARCSLSARKSRSPVHLIRNCVCALNISVLPSQGTGSEFTAMRHLAARSLTAQVASPFEFTCEMYALRARGRTPYPIPSLTEIVTTSKRRKLLD